MSTVPINPNVVPLLQGLKPYIGSNAQVISDSVINLVNLLTSHHGQEAVQSVTKVFTTSGKDERVFTVDTFAGPISFNLGMVFAMFLILILLVLSASFLTLGPSLLGDNQQAEGLTGTEV